MKEGEGEETALKASTTTLNQRSSMEFPIKKLSFSKALEEAPVVEMKNETTEEEKEPKEDPKMKAALEVLLRIRPLTTKEAESQNNIPCIVPNEEDSSLVRVQPPENSRAFRNDQKIENFTFTHVFGPETKQNELFEKRIQDRVDAMFDERSALVMSYGITNAGKSFTILGNEENPGTYIYNRVHQTYC